MKKFLLLVLTVLLTAAPATAKLQFSAPITVDVTAEDAVQAKEIAMRQAQRDAFLEIAGKLTDTEHAAELEKLTDDEIVHFVQSVGVNDEKAGGNKYMATLTVQLDETLLRDYLAENGMIEVEATELTVIPIFKPQNSYTPLLWENENLWRRSWLSKGLIKFGTIQMHTAGEHFRQINNLNAQTALYMDTELFNAVSNLNGSDKIYIVYAETMPNADLKITVKDEKNKAEDNFTILNDESDNLFDKAIEKSVMFISNMERRAAYNQNPTTADSLNAVYMYTDMKDWLNKSAALSALPMVENIDTKSFGGGKVNFSLRYTGSLDDLWTALQELGLSHEAADNYYIIR
ncbi:MAG: hypothetical protein IJ824_03335 [Alphaproteobacteria bacterium]|nr:hypothetical protein [Alphaproteobacteria bacterium]